jgi:lipoprotein-releasing system permease protein
MAGLLGFEWRVALRFLREGRLQTLLIVVGVAAGVAVVTYISVLIDGLQRNTLARTLGAQAHVVLLPPDERVQPVLPLGPAGEPRFGDVQVRAQRLRALPDWPARVRALDARAGVVGVSATLGGAALAQRGEATRAVTLTGVDLDRHDRIVGLHARTVAGQARLGPGEAVAGVTLAEDLGVRVGDLITVSSGARAQTLRITALVDLGATELNRRMLYAPLRSAQSLFDLPGGAARIEIALADVWAAQALADALARQWPLRVESWQQTNAQLVSALNAQRVSTTLIRAVVLLVVVLGIASVLVVSVVQKQREIGILRAMGATRGQVQRVFLLQGALLGAAGSLLGLGLALAMVAAFMHFARGADGLPLFAITLPPALALQVAAVALLAGVLAAIAPARRAARLEPAQAIRT